VAATISAAHINKSAQHISADPSHLLSSGEGTTVTVMVGRDVGPGHVPLRVTASSNAQAIIAYEQFMGIIHDGKTRVF
jgi:hypothetical protein